MTDFPHCRRRGLLIDTAGGPNPGDAMSDTPKCPHCKSARRSEGTAYSCGTLPGDHRAPLCVALCRIRELEASALATDAQIAELQAENERLDEIVRDDASKWSFDALMFLAKRLLDANYPDRLFGPDAPFGKDVGPQFVTALRRAIEEVERVTPSSGSAAEE